MTQASQATVVWSIAIASIVLLILGAFAISSVNNTIRDSASDIDVPTASEIVAAVNIPTAAEIAALIPVTDLSIIDGADGQWDVDSNFLRNKAVDKVIDELEDSNNKDLFRAIETLVDIEDNDENDRGINDVVIHKIGTITVNQARYDSMDDSGRNTVLKVDFVIEVEFNNEDGDDVTKYFRVQATITDLEDGIDNGDVSIDSITRVSRTFVLP